MQPEHVGLERRLRPRALDAAWHIASWWNQGTASIPPTMSSATSATNGLRSARSNASDNGLCAIPAGGAEGDARTWGCAGVRASTGTRRVGHGTALGRLERGTCARCPLNCLVSEEALVSRLHPEKRFMICDRYEASLRKQGDPFRLSYGRQSVGHH